ncbi:hypothetical protein MSG28_006168 [Choristoneura fumiferana]|uniref:Uncharacterized protein n=2 Tax=Choristoneura fumiferana TaxID=7141 RepID=A0ACC0JDW1_CHOFU|nr:hypothetical protein MSG28_006164 [Choristoneura fumiferana]KAI8422287.1 hypothetical protein MSG28_006168 [Choristoneura fumiferana]
MWIAQCCFLLLNFIGLSTGLLCYNCSSTNRDWNHCSGDFGTASPFAFNSSRLFLINCTGGLATLNTKYASVKRTGATRRNHTSHTERYSS